MQLEPSTVSYLSVSIIVETNLKLILDMIVITALNAHFSIQVKPMFKDKNKNKNKINAVQDLAQTQFNQNINNVSISKVRVGD